MNITNRTVDEYLQSLDEPMRTDVESLHKLICDHMPEVQPKMWEGVFWGGSQQSIIGYGQLSYTRSDKQQVEWFVVGLSKQKNYISVYITGTEGNEYVVKKYAHLLGNVKTTSSAIRFSRLDEVNLDELMLLVDKTAAQHRS